MIQLCVMLASAELTNKFRIPYSCISTGIRTSVKRGFKRSLSARFATVTGVSKAATYSASNSKFFVVEFGTPKLIPIVSEIQCDDARHYPQLVAGV